MKEVNRDACSGSSSMDKYKMLQLFASSVQDVLLALPPILCWSISFSFLKTSAAALQMSTSTGQFPHREMIITSEP